MKKIITDFLLKKTNYVSIIVRGNIGVGKYTYIENIAKENNFLVLSKIIDNDIENEEFKDFLESLITNKISVKTKSNAQDTKKNNYYQKKVTIIRDIDSLSSSKRSELFKMIGIKKCSPIIFTTSDYSVGFTRSINSSILILEFKIKPMTFYTSNWYKKSFPISKKKFIEIVKELNYDIRQVIFLNESLSRGISVNFIKDIKLDPIKSLELCNKNTNSLDLKQDYVSQYTSQMVFQNYPNFNEFKVQSDTKKNNNSQQVQCQKKLALISDIYTLNLDDEYSNIIQTVYPLIKQDNLPESLLFPSSNLFFSESVLNFRKFETEYYKIKTLPKKIINKDDFEYFNQIKKIMSL